MSQLTLYNAASRVFQPRFDCPSELVGFGFCILYSAFFLAARPHWPRAAPHREKFDKPFAINDPVEPAPQNVPTGTPEISQGRSPWKLITVKSCVPQGTPEPEPKPANAAAQPKRGWTKRNPVNPVHPVNSEGQSKKGWAKL